MIHLADAAATDALGHRLAAALRVFDRGIVISLRGELGAGKTALARAILRGLGHEGRVVSPSYTLVEPYTLGARTLFHLDLYRLGDPEELEFLGIREIDTGRDWVFIEWAERGAGFLPPLDLEIRLAYAGSARQVEFCALTPIGEQLVAALDFAR
ncbi:ATPase [Salinisphaera sp. S4-8]|uniref:tRNA (adenosine(37)-N6)-threonylcarbamoyltransferase complex ATPase subunit type 1 TsaE n=1 Tax=Salinisphaera sp. S4-8 TaxID=633357 RepID=UPI003341FAA8